MNKKVNSNLEFKKLLHLTNKDILKNSKVFCLGVFEIEKFHVWHILAIYEGNLVDYSIFDESDWLVVG